MSLQPTGTNHSLLAEQLREHDDVISAKVDDRDGVWGVEVEVKHSRVLLNLEEWTRELIDEDTYWVTNDEPSSLRMVTT